MTKTKLLVILMFSLLWSLEVQSQIYYKRIRYVNNHFSQELPRGYIIFITGPVEANVNEVRLSISEQNQTPDVYIWERINSSQTEFEILISRPLERKTTFTHELTKIMASVGGGAPFTSSTNPQPGTPEVNPTSRWGLVSGIGYSFLGKKGNTDHDMFGYVAVKFIFSKRVNKTNKFLDDSPTSGTFSTRVYETAWDRFSLLVGGSTTRMGFKGKELLNPVYNVKPMIGLSFDFSPEISLDAGLLFYDYQKGNASLYTDLDSKLGTGIFISISIDMDVFTRLKFAFAGKPYNKTDPN
jgi:hypothetical protein